MRLRNDAAIGQAGICFFDPGLANLIHSYIPPGGPKCYTTGMPEKRIYQRRFDDLLRLEYAPQDVTPEGFSGIVFPGREPAARPPMARLGAMEQPGRFVNEVSEPLQITSPAEAARYFMEAVFTPFDDCLQEELWGIPLDSKNVCRFVSLIYRGNVNTAIVRPAECFREAIRVNATALILAHNHPSGN